MNQAFRFANEGADDNSWAQYVLAMERMNIGLNTCKLYDDGGVLKISEGRIGIDNGVQPSICEIDTVTTINLTGSTSIWQEVYMTVVGTAVSFATINIAGATDWSTLPAGFTGAYNAEKEGYYINAARRCIGIVWADSAGNLEGIINTESGREGYHGYSYYDSAEENNNHPLYFKKLLDVEKIWGDWDIGDWNMDTTTFINITHNISSIAQRIIEFNVQVRNDINSLSYPLNYPGNVGGDAQPVLYAITGSITFTLYRVTGSLFDSVNFDSTSYNRGFIAFRIKNI